MAGIGADSYLTKEQVKAAFDAARRAGHDRLVHYHRPDLDFAATHEHGIECFADHVENTVSYERQDCYTEDNDGFQSLARHISCYDTERIIEIYDLSQPFENAAGGLDLLDVELFDAAAEYRALRERPAVPWYKKFLGYQP